MKGEVDLNKSSFTREWANSKTPIYLGAEEEGTIGIALNLESNNVGVVLMGDGLMIQEGSSVKATGRIAQIPVSEAYLGRVINALAKPIDGRGEISASESRLIESPAPGIISRRSVYEPLQTGLIAIDAMIPIGRGQREFIIGDSNNLPAKQQ